MGREQKGADALALELAPGLIRSARRSIVVVGAAGGAASLGVEPEVRGTRRLNLAGQRVGVFDFVEWEATLAFCLAVPPVEVSRDIVGCVKRLKLCRPAGSVSGRRIGNVQNALAGYRIETVEDVPVVCLLTI